jgi:DNA-3-methyladenine glycosylase II
MILSQFHPDYWDEAKKHLSKKDKVLKAIIKSYEGELLVTKGDAFFTLCRAIVGQQISVKAADTIWKRFNEAVGKLNPKNVLATPTEKLRTAGLSQSKVNYLYSLSEHFLKNKKMIQSWPKKSDEEIIKELTTVKGLGRWSVEMFLIFHLGRPDVFPIADIGVQKAMFRHYHNSDKVPLKELAKRAEGWAPYRSVATWYLWRSLDPVPVEY